MHTDLIAAARQAGADECCRDPRLPAGSPTSSSSRSDRSPDDDRRHRRRPRARLQGRVLRTPLRRSDWLSDHRRRASSQARNRPAHQLVQDSRRVQRGAASSGRAGREPAALVTASAGNHGRALAYAAATLGIPLTVFIAADAPRAEGRRDPRRRRRAAAVRRLRRGRASGQGARGRRRRALHFPYSHPDVIAGAGTICLEVLEICRRSTPSSCRSAAAG